MKLLIRAHIFLLVVLLVTLTSGQSLAADTENGEEKRSGIEVGEEYVTPELREERSRETITRIVSSHASDIRYAYNRELRKNPTLQGKIVVTLTISAEGQVTECRVKETEMNWPPLEESLVEMFKTWTFPEIPEGEVTVSYPFVFFPSM